MFNFFSKSNSTIEQNIINKIKFDPCVASIQANVCTNEGFWAVRGRVPHYSEKSQADHATQRVEGVWAVANEIEINLMGSFIRSNEGVAESALSAFAWSYYNGKYSFLCRA